MHRLLTLGNMITGKGRIWKMAALFGLVLLAVLDLIFGTQSIVVEWINSLLVAGTLGLATYKLYQRWKDKDGLWRTN